MKTVSIWALSMPVMCLVALLVRTGRRLIVEGIGGVAPLAVGSVLFDSAQALVLPALVVGALFGVLRSRWSPDWMRPPAAILSELGMQAGGFGFLLAVVLMRGVPPEPEATLFTAFILSSAATLGIRLARHQIRRDPGRLVYTWATQLLIDGFIVVTSWLFAFIARFDGLPPFRYQGHLLLILPVVLAAQLCSNYVAGTYRFVWRFTGLYEALRVMASAFAALALLVLANLFVPPSMQIQRIPFSVLILYGFFVLAGMLGVRILRRLQFDYTRLPNRRSHVQGRRTLLVGAGQAGTVLARELSARRHFHICGFLDDDTRKQGRLIAGVKVLGALEDLEDVIASQGIEEVILSMPSAASEIVRGVVARCEQLAVRVSTVPDVADLLTGRDRISDLRPVRMEDLLGRAAVHYDNDENLEQAYGGRRILITGAGGSIGSELARQLLLLQPECLVLLDKDENSLYEVGLEIAESGGRFEEVVADVRQQKRMERVFARYRPQVVFHAAAYKHVPMMEKHPCEAILNNVLGSAVVAGLAQSTGCSSFVLISTDKAVRPTSVMGASKRIAEMIVQNRSAEGSATRFCGVRFGNVLGSRASVVPLFQKRISEGKPLHVTHPDVTRYFMTIPEAVQLVIQAGSLGRDGELFILDMGDPVRIADLARELVHLSGLTPGEDIQLEFTGLRPGEKLFEELLIDDESGDRSTRYPKIFVARRDLKVTPRLEDRLSELIAAARSEETDRVLSLLVEFGFTELEQTKGVAEPR